MNNERLCDHTLFMRSILVPLVPTVPRRSWLRRCSPFFFLSFQVITRVKVALEMIEHGCCLSQGPVSQWVRSDGHDAGRRGASIVTPDVT